jgi:phosphohistidine phosphatase SixA
MIFIRRMLALTIISLTVIYNQGCTTLTHSQENTTTTIILTRHGERNAFADDLNDKGRQRAKDLVKALEGIDISAIYCPNRSRNIDTATPLAEHLGLKVNIVDKSPSVSDLINTFLTKHAGKKILWVGNNDNLSTMYSLLRGEGDPPVDYGDLFIIVIRDKGDPEIIKKTYGQH